MVATRGLIAASTSPFAMPMVSVAAKRTRKFGAAIVAMVPAMWPAAARRSSVPIPSRSHSGPPSRIERPNPQNAAGDPPDVGLAEAEVALEVAHDVAADGERQRRGEERDTAGDEKPALVHRDPKKTRCTLS